MTAVVSVPLALATLIGGDLSRGTGIPTKETPHRVYFLVPLLALLGRGPMYLQTDIEIGYFPTREEAMAWAERDATTRARDAERTVAH